MPYQPSIQFDEGAFRKEMARALTEWHLLGSPIQDQLARFPMRRGQGRPYFVWVTYDLNFEINQASVKDAIRSACEERDFNVCSLSVDFSRSGRAHLFQGGWDLGMGDECEDRISCTVDAEELDIHSIQLRLRDFLGPWYNLWLRDPYGAIKEHSEYCGSDVDDDGKVNSPLQTVIVSNASADSWTYGLIFWPKCRHAEFLAKTCAYPPIIDVLETSSNLPGPAHISRFELMLDVLGTECLGPYEDRDIASALAAVALRWRSPDLWERLVESDPVRADSSILGRQNIVKAKEVFGWVDSLQGGCLI
ncbi:hypothetical protein JAAARDRAFT_205006 [Jaapia argillacea MUCL 33604]|uniref:Uncharacterized protein n=1 Tax=Jaapia argillacea MUCL 33604 TaxID=933084 RepID=A0A067Q550_9AGAM|nr:hypothetical protein JAAARDRAFT_205006 [Jaapia argillacea MUCL 33604]